MGRLEVDLVSNDGTSFLCLGTVPGFDLVHAHDWITYPAGVAAARARGVPLVCHLHATEYDRTGDSPDAPAGRCTAWISTQDDGLTWRFPAPLSLAGRSGRPPALTRRLSSRTTADFRRAS